MMVNNLTNKCDHKENIVMINFNPTKKGDHKGDG